LALLVASGAIAPPIGEFGLGRYVDALALASKFREGDLPPQSLSATTFD
jgi:hypothetical protein